MSRPILEICEELLELEARTGLTEWEAQIRKDSQGKWRFMGPPKTERDAKLDALFASGVKGHIRSLCEALKEAHEVLIRPDFTCIGGSFSSSQSFLVKTSELKNKWLKKYSQVSTPSNDGGGGE
jgi:hypothetical protein